MAPCLTSFPTRSCIQFSSLHVCYMSIHFNLPIVPRVLTTNTRNETYDVVSPDLIWLPTLLRPNIILFSNNLNLDSWNSLAIGKSVRGIVLCYSGQSDASWLGPPSKQSYKMFQNYESWQVTQPNSWWKKKTHTFCNIIPFRTHESSDSCAWLCILAAWSHSVSSHLVNLAPLL